MCNPRRVNIEVNRSIQEAWQRTIEQSATARDEVAETATMNVDIPLDEQLGEMALEMLERVLAGEFESVEGWERDEEGNFFNEELEGVRLVYDTRARRLRMEARLAEQISVEVREQAEAAGFTVGEVAAEAVGHYYDDGWGGRTESWAREEARKNAERRLGKAVDDLHRAQNQEEFERAEAEAKAKAEAKASEELEQKRQEVRNALRERLQGTLSQAQDNAYYLINRAVGEAYRQTLLRLVRENGGRTLKDESTGSVINLEIEL